MIINFANLGGGGGGGYVLPVASASRLGGVKIGDGINIDSAGTISVSGGSAGDATKLEAVSSLPASAENGTVVALKDVQVNANGKNFNTEGDIAYIPFFENGNIRFVLNHTDHDIIDGFCDITDGEVTDSGWIPYGFWEVSGGVATWTSSNKVFVRVSKSQDGTLFVIERGDAEKIFFAIDNASAYTLENRIYQYDNDLGWVEMKYTLPKANTWALGGVIVNGSGSGNINIDSAGTISVPVATKTVKGVVRIGDGLGIDGNGKASVEYATKLASVETRPADAGVGSIISEYRAAGIGWQTFDASDEPTWARIAVNGDGDYRMDFNNGDSFFSLTVSNGSASDTYGNLTVVTAGSEWLFNRDGFQVSVYYDGDYVTGHITSGNTSFLYLDGGGAHEEGVTVSQVGPNPLYAVDEQDVIVWTAWDNANPYGWTHIRFNKTDDTQYFCYGWLDGVNFWVDWDVTNQQYGGDNFSGWTKTDVSGNNFTATKGGHTAVAVDDGTKITFSFDSAIEDSWGGYPHYAERGDDSKQSIYESLVTSASVTKLWSGTQAQYDALVSGGLINNSTFYIIKANS